MLDLKYKKLQEKSFLITGASGLIGSALVDLLMSYNRESNARIEIYTVSRNRAYAEKQFHTYWNDSNFHYISHDITEPFLLDVPLDYIIHGASNASPKCYASDPVGTMKANLWGVSNMLELAREKEARLLYISSGEVYGEGDGRDFTEDYSGYVDCLNPRSCYPSSKRASETLCVSYKEQYGVNVAIARPCHIYGPDTGRDDRAFAQFLRLAKRGENIVLKSEGKQVRSYCHVDDCASALLYILLKGESGEAYNIANRESILSIRELAEMIAHMASVKVIQDIPSAQESKGYSKVQRAVLDPSKLEKLGWKPEFSIKEGISCILTCE